MRISTLVLLCHTFRRIYIFAPDTDAVLGWMEMVFTRLKNYHLKIKPKKCHFFHSSVVFWGHVHPLGCILANQKKGHKVKNWPVSQNVRGLHSFHGLPSYYKHFISQFVHLTQCLLDLIGVVNKKREKLCVKIVKVGQLISKR